MDVISFKSEAVMGMETVIVPQAVLVAQIQGQGYAGLVDEWNR